jgi:hypothetical protein
MNIRACPFKVQIKILSVQSPLDATEGWNCNTEGNMEIVSLN